MPEGMTLDAVIILLEWEKPETWVRASDCSFTDYLGGNVEKA